MVKEGVSNKANWKDFCSCEAEIDGLVDNTTPGNTKEELLILELLMKQLLYAGLPLYAPHWLSITSYPARRRRIINDYPAKLRGMPPDT